MEVHHHAHADPAHGGTSRKKFTHYLWEFLMLFLAVFCGFLAENQREHMIEHQREKQYIRSMIEDLQTDTLNLSIVINGFLRKEKNLDTVMSGYDESIHSYSPVWARNFLLSYRGGFPDFYYTDRTIQQLKNSGGMRLVKNETAADGIIKYDAGMKDLEYEESFISKEQLDYINEILKLWSVNKMYKDAGVSSWTNNKDLIIKENCWITKDPVAFEQLFNKLAEYKEGVIRHRLDFIDMKKKAVDLIALLKKGYHFN